jgi:hypothetical protein
MDITVSVLVHGQEVYLLTDPLPAYLGHLVFCGTLRYRDGQATVEPAGTDAECVLILGAALPAFMTHVEKVKSAEQMGDSVQFLERLYKLGGQQ